MRDYEGLVKRLQDFAAGTMRDEDAQTAFDAIDAIVELQKCVEAEYQSGFADGQISANRKKSKWISVEERLPDGGVHVLACCRAKWLAGSENLYVCDAFHSNPKTIVCSYDDDIDSEYDEETDEYYFPEGWWEVIKNWGDYSCVAIEDVVTHWMPLPEPPSGES